MNIWNLGSINIDRVYSLDHVVAPGETESATALAEVPGGKGFNQSVALARAGARVSHIGAIGPDGAHLARMLRDAGADTAHLASVAEPTGHAIIQVDKDGRNSIVVFAAANGAISPASVRAALAGASQGDVLLCQNETSAVADAMREAKSRGMRVVFNPSPFDAKIPALPLELVDLFIVNETEEAGLLALGGAPAAAPRVVTRGAAGCESVAPGRELVRADAFRVKAVDTTAAGDTFTGYYLAALAAGAGEGDALRRASAAAAISVPRPGAAPSIPSAAEVDAFLATADGACAADAVRV